MEAPALMEAQTVPTSARYIDKLTTVGTCSTSMENEATRTLACSLIWSFSFSLSLPPYLRIILSMSCAVWVVPQRIKPEPCDQLYTRKLNFVLGILGLNRTAIHVWIYIFFISCWKKLDYASMNFYLDWFVLLTDCLVLMEACFHLFWLFYELIN